MIEMFNRGAPSANVQVPFHDPALGGDARASLTELADALLALPAFQNFVPGVGGSGLPDGDLGDVVKLGDTLTVPELAVKANTEDLKTNAQAVVTGSTVGPIDTTKQHNERSISAATTLAFNAAPAAANTYFGCAIKNTSSANLTVTIPSSYSMRQQSAITSFVLPANGRADLVWRWDGATYVLFGEPVRDAFQAVFAIVGTSAARSYPVILDNARQFVVTSVVTKCASGSDTATVSIGGVPLGGAANSVLSVKQTQVHASANVAGLAADVTVAFATGGAVDPQVTIKGYFL